MKRLLEFGANEGILGTQYQFSREIMEVSHHIEQVLTSHIVFNERGRPRTQYSYEPRESVIVQTRDQIKDQSRWHLDHMSLQLMPAIS